MLPIALSMVEGCAQSPRINVPGKYASAHQPIARLASEILLSNLRELIKREHLNFVMIA